MKRGQTSENGGEMRGTGVFGEIDIVDSSLIGSGH